MSLLDYVCTHAVSGGEKRMLYPLELEVTGNCEPPNIMLETKFGTSARSVCSLNC